MSRIVLLVEGKTEKAIAPALKRFLDQRCCEEGRDRVRLEAQPVDSLLLKKDKVDKLVRNNLAHRDVVGVVALIDVVASGRPRQIKDAREAIRHLRSCCAEQDGYRAHAAQYDLEAWLLPYWADICGKLGVNRRKPGGAPESVNHLSPPSKRLAALYRQGGKEYDKVRDARLILEDKNLLVAAEACPQFEAFLNSLLHFARCRPIS